MFTEYHLNKIIDAINEAERRQTNALLEAFSIDKLTKALEKSKGEQTVITVDKPEIKPLFVSAPQNSFFAEEFEKEKFGTSAIPVKKAPAKKGTTTKKPTGAKK